jgi:sulfur oxidation c-type cytochrome SoxX
MKYKGWIAVGLGGLLLLVFAQPPAPHERVYAAEAPGAGAEPALVGRPDVGKALFAKYECLNCHSIRGKGATMGPDLAQVGIRRSTAWLNNFVYDPSELFPESPMPRPEWKSEQEVADVVAFLMSLKREIPKEQILAAKASQIEKGEAFVQAYDCRACHAIGEGTGVAGYPDLTRVGRKIRPEWERRWLQDTQKVKPGTFMPTFGFSDPELDVIVAYLHSLK